MTQMLKGAIIGGLAVVVAGGIGTVVFVKATGLSARATPGSVETTLARRVRSLAVPGEYANLTNPVLSNHESVRHGMAHFADHCAICHANNGSGDAEMGRGMFPRAPDMRQEATQGLSDGNLFYLIEHGVRFGGMPAWGTGTIDGEESSWHLVNFIRHLPRLTEEEVQEMAAMNPRPPAEIRQEIEAERFLGGEDPAPDAEPAPSHVH
jgi:mono/diheme cytochrome c family protein